MFRAGLRAPDHGQLHPWRFLIIEGDARHKLGELFAAALRERDAGAAEEALQKARNMPLRAPMLVLVIASVKPHPKVPGRAAAGCRLRGSWPAARGAWGIGAVWRTGEFSYDPRVLEGLGLTEQERLLGFLGYAGRARTQRAGSGAQDFVQRWNAQ